MLNFLFGSGGDRRRAGIDWWPNSGGWVGGRVRTAAGAVVDEDTALTYAACWCATRVIAETVAGLPLILYQREGDEGRRPARDHAQYDRLKTEPCPGMGSMIWREGRTMHQVNWGQGFAEIERTRAGDVAALWPIHPSRVKPVRPEDNLGGQYKYTVRNNDGSGMPMRADEILHIPGVLSEDGTWAKGVVTYARQTVGFGLSTELHGATSFGAGNIPKIVLTTPGFKDKDQRANFRQEWREIHGNPQSAEIAIVPPESKIEKMNFSNDDAQFLGTRKHNVTEIARWYRLQPHMLGDLDRATFSNIEQQAIEFITYSLLPWLLRWEEQLDLKLLTPEERKSYYFEHNLAGLLRGDFKTRIEAYQQAIMIGVLSINEARRLENMPGIGPAGDEYYVPLNMTTANRMYLGLPAPNAPMGNPELEKESKALQGRMVRKTDARSLLLDLSQGIRNRSF